MNAKRKDSCQYEDIINLPHHVSRSHPPMPVSNRAAQFSPFAALSGYDAAIRETARQTVEKIELDEDIKAALNARLRQLQESLGEQPEVTVTYFQPDVRKTGGAYVSLTGRVRKLDQYQGLLILADETTVPIADISEIEGELFE